MSDFIRSSDDNTPIWRLNDEIVLGIGRPGANLECNSIGSDHPKQGDPPLYRREDDETFDRLPAYITYRPDDSPTFTRLPGDDSFNRRT